MLTPEAQRRFLKMASLTTAAVYFLILVGGIVRASGAGMGCPDWPTCFGRWIPPTQESDLPANYQEIYAARGYADTRFNPVKTWTEYVNRLIGVSIGLLILGTLFRSLPYRKHDPAVFHTCLAVFLLVAFQGWLGAAVVASNLKPIMITGHMVTAFLIVSLLIYALVRSQRDLLGSGTMDRLPTRFRGVLLAAMAMTLLQIAMGTQIRESVDVIAAAFGRSERHLWREDFPIIFYIHRSFSLVILLTNLWLAWQVTRVLSLAHGYARLAVILASLVILAIVAGIVLDRLGFPAVAQPIHLLLANLIFGAQLALFLIAHFAIRGARHAPASA